MALSHPPARRTRRRHVRHGHCAGGEVMTSVTSGPSALLTGPVRGDHVAMELESLSEEECYYLLATSSIGRVGISVRALPEVLPVNYAVLDGDVIIRTGAGTKLDAALTNAVVAFE